MTTRIEVEFGDYKVWCEFPFNIIIENMKTAKNEIKKTKKLLKLIDADKDIRYEDLPDYIKRHRNWLALNKNNCEFLRLKQMLYTSIVDKESLIKNLPTLKNKFMTTLNDVLEIYEEGLKIEALNEGEYLESVNDIKEAYDYNIELIKTLELMLGAMSAHHEKEHLSQST